MDIIAIASTRAAIAPNSGTICVPMISIIPVPAVNGTVIVLVSAVVVSVDVSFSSPSTTRWSNGTLPP